LFWLLALATLPVLLVGLVLAQLDLIDVLRQPKVIAWATIGFAVPLWLADRYGTRARAQEQLRWRDFLLLGLAQACAAIPGASRAGVTVTAGRWLGLDRKAAAHISMLMAIPTIIAAGSYSALDLYLSGDLALGLDALFAAVMSFFTALLAIWALMAWVDRIGYGPFVLYRLVLGGALLYWLS